MTVGEKIKYIRLFRNIHQKELASALGFAKSSMESRISQIEKGVRTPRANLVEKISELLSVSTFVLQDHIDDKVTNIIMNMFWNEIEMREYASNSSAPNSKNAILIFNRTKLDSIHERIKQSTDSSDLLTRALIEYQEYKQLVYTGIITFEDFLSIMFNWDYNSEVGKEIYKK